MATKAITKKKAPVKKAAPKSKPIRAVESKHIISYSKGEEMKAAYMEYIKAVKPTVKINFNNGREFDKALFEQLLQVSGVKKIRIYNALNDKNEHTFVITAVNKRGFNLVVPMAAARSGGSATKSVAGGGEGGVGNMGNQCTDPSYKPPTAP